MRTLRSRLLLGTAIGTATVLLVAGIALFALFRSALWQEFDESLATKARSLAAMMELDGDALDLEFDEANLPEFRPSATAEYFEVWLNDAEAYACSPSLAGGDLPRITGSIEAPGFQTLSLPDGRRGRLAGISFMPRREGRDTEAARPTVTFVLARETASIDHTLAQLRWILAGVGVAAVLVSVGVLAWLVQRGLHPVRRLAGEISEIGVADLSARLNGTDVPGELSPVVDRLNDLLQRLESAFQRERRFSADVAHELRTPLAGVRSILEVALSKPREGATYQQAMAECLTINRHMHQMMENLLHLARADADQLTLASETVDLPALLRECWTPLEQRASEKGLTVSWRLQEPCTLRSDVDKLRLVLQNLLDNAVAYANRGGQIAIESVSANGETTLTISNTGSTLSPADLNHVFDRFWRGDAARKATGQHCGLGLALCRTVTTLLGGSIRISTAPPDRFIVTFCVQCAAAEG
ncbi:MAG: HAMP domain-containing protein [Phycisphaerae bacterium]|nr:HAMP domain-containing protein [Phycisphaerae bacterium]